MTGFHRKNPANPTIFEAKAGSSMWRSVWRSVWLLGAWRSRPRNDMLGAENTGSFYENLVRESLFREGLFRERLAPRACDHVAGLTGPCADAEAEFVAGQ
jgi:hypothetical protein